MSRATRRFVVCLTLLAIAGTLCACGRYGPPKRRPTEAAATSGVSGSAERVLEA